MKLSLETYILCKRFGDYEGLKRIKEAGFDCVDMSYYWLPDDSEQLSDGYRDYAKSLRQYLDTIGLECNQAHAPFDLQVGEEFSLETSAFLAIVRAMESAALLGAKTIIVHSLAEGIVFDRQYNLDFYKSLEPFCEKFNIRIGVENLFAFDAKRQCYTGRLKTAKELCEFILELNSPWFVACVDVGHAALTGSEPEDFILGMSGNLLQAVHIQDGDYRGDRHTLPYLGQFNWEKIMQALRQVDYSSELTFEIFKYLRQIPNDLMPEALALAERTGRHLISIFEEQ